MTPANIGVAALNAASLALSFVPGQAKLSGIFAALANGLQSGMNVDAHMAEIAAKMKAGKVSDADWDSVMARIQVDSQRLQKA